MDIVKLIFCCHRRRSNQIQPGLPATIPENGNGEISSDGEQQTGATRTTAEFTGILDIPKDYKEESFYIQTTTIKTIHCLRIKASEISTRESQNKSPSSSTDEEYWFTRFSRKPKLKKEVITNTNELTGLESRIIFNIEKFKNLNNCVSFTNYGYENDKTDDGCSPNSTNINSSPTLPLQPPPVLLFFIHGIGTSSSLWNLQYQYFNKLGYEIVAPDLVGHGMSGGPSGNKNYTFESIVQDIVYVFDQFSQGFDRIVLIGHGYGSSIASVLTRIRPEKIKILISVSGGGPNQMAPPADYKKSLFTIFRKLIPQKQKPRLINKDLINTIPQNILTRMIRGQYWPDGDTSFYRKIHIPTLLVYGLRDNVVSLIEECEMERTIPKCWLEIIPTAGHMIMWEEGKILNDMISRFISEWV